MLVFFVVWIIDSFFIRYTTFLFAFSLKWLYGILGMIVLSVSVYYLYASLKDLFHTEDWSLKTTGVFAHVRNPMYIGIVLFYLGLILLTLSLATLAVWFAICFYYNGLADYEETQLQEKFGEEFVEYKKSVRKWIPF